MSKAFHEVVAGWEPINTQQHRILPPRLFSAFQVGHHWDKDYRLTETKHILHGHISYEFYAPLTPKSEYKYRERLAKQALVRTVYGPIINVLGVLESQIEAGDQIKALETVRGMLKQLREASDVNT